LIIIVGQGLAGTLVAYNLLMRNEAFIMIDEQPQFSASKVATGLFNPINGRRMVVSRNAVEFLKKAEETYLGIEKLIGEKIYFRQNIYQLFGSIKDQNDFSRRNETPDFRHFVNSSPPKEQHLKNEYGAFETRQSGWVSISLMIELFAQKMLEQNRLMTETFEYDKLLQNADKTWQYKQIKADKVIFCEGYKGQRNPFFNRLPIRRSKGELLIIRCNNISKEKIIKKSIYLVHIGNGFYKAGSTYDWNAETESPEQPARQYLAEKLDALLDCEYEITDHLAGIRAVIPDLKVAVGEHPEQKWLYVFNGLGARGAMHAPYYAGALVQYLMDGMELPDYADVKRFWIS